MEARVISFTVLYIIQPTDSTLYRTLTAAIVDISYCVGLQMQEMVRLNAERVQGTQQAYFRTAANLKEAITKVKTKVKVRPLDQPPSTSLRRCAIELYKLA